MITEAALVTDVRARVKNMLCYSRWSAGIKKICLNSGWTLIVSLQACWNQRSWSDTVSVFLNIFGFKLFSVIFEDVSLGHRKLDWMFCDVLIIWENTGQIKRGWLVTGVYCCWNLHLNFIILPTNIKKTYKSCTDWPQQHGLTSKKPFKGKKCVTTCPYFISCCQTHKLYCEPTWGWDCTKLQHGGKY